MHNIFAGFMGIWMGVTSFFHGGHATIHMNSQTNENAGTSASGSAQQNQRPFFGTVTNVNGSTITIQAPMMMMRPYFRTTTPSVTPPAPKTLTIILTNTTVYSGGSQTDITTNTRIAGIGTLNSDGSITATRIQINPTIPTGMPKRGFGIGSIPSGKTLIIGQITAVNGNTITVQNANEGNSDSDNNSDDNNPHPAQQTLTVDLTSNTQYTNGSQSSLQVGTRIVGYGSVNSDSSINAEKLTINHMHIFRQP